MKKILLILTITLSLTTCKTEKKTSNQLYGKWIIKQTLIDPGDGSGKYIDFSNDTSHITFMTDGSAYSNAEIFGLQLVQSYHIIQKNQLQLSFSPISSQPTTLYLYEFAGDTLVIHPPCIEGCGIKLAKK